MPHAYSQDQIVGQPAIGLFAELGWTRVSALEEIFGVNGTLSCEIGGKVVLVSKLRAARDVPVASLPKCPTASSRI